jgi:hypothetical protein
MSDDVYKGLEKTTIKSDACNLPTHTFLKIQNADAQGKFVEERWCLACSLKHGELMRSI